MNHEIGTLDPPKCYQKKKFFFVNSECYSSFRLNYSRAVKFYVFQPINCYNCCLWPITQNT